MKKILLIIAIALCIFQMVVLAIAIDVGGEAADYNNYTATYTVVDKTNPANASGTITSIEIWAVTGNDLTGCEVAIFYVVSGNYLSTRSNVTLGTVTSGSKQTITVDSGGNPISLNIVEGDFIGTYVPAGRLEKNTSGGAGDWYKAGDNIPCTNTAFSAEANNMFACKGLGSTPATDNAIFFGTNL